MTSTQAGTIQASYLPAVPDLLPSQGLSELAYFLQTSSATLVPIASFEYLSVYYAFRHEGVIRSFLQIRPYLVDLLVDAIDFIYLEFGDGVPVHLELEVYEGKSERSELYARIRTTRMPEAAFDALSAFDRKWWLGALERAEGELVFTVQLS